MSETPTKTFKEILTDFLDELSEYLEANDSPPEIQSQLDDAYVQLESIVEFL